MFFVLGVSERSHVTLEFELELLLVVLLPLFGFVPLPLLVSVLALVPEIVPELVHELVGLSFSIAFLDGLGRGNLHADAGGLASVHVGVGVERTVVLVVVGLALEPAVVLVIAGPRLRIVGFGVNVVELRLWRTLVLELRLVRLPRPVRSPRLVLELGR